MVGCPSAIPGPTLWLLNPSAGPSRLVTEFGSCEVRYFSNKKPPLVISPSAAAKTKIAGILSQKRPFPWSDHRPAKARRSHRPTHRNGMTKPPQKTLGIRRIQGTPAQPFLATASIARCLPPERWRPEVAASHSKIGRLVGFAHDLVAVVLELDLQHAESGVMYYRKRYYHTALGCFIFRSHSSPSGRDIANGSCCKARLRYSAERGSKAIKPNSGAS
jgi:hypothetical protein